ncbi:hypothetical protein NL523_28110, partial [Klebsiella pneumoniae]|nr:hypothetical protein [Klebsiella pneumoniae]MCP6663614.1 hypothetical protein [Klebsiella pneumoniae]
KQNHDASYATVLSKTRQKTEIVNQLFNDAMATQDKALKQRISQLNERQATLFKIVIGSSILGILAIIVLLIWYSRQLSSRMGNLRSD